MASNRARRKTPERTAESRPAGVAAWCSVVQHSGLSDLAAAELADVDFGLVDESRPDAAFAKARAWRKRNWFVSAVLRLRQSFFNYGFKLKSKDQKALDQWLSNPASARMLHWYVRDLWAEWLSLDCAISLWFTSGARPTLLHPDQCEYSDELGQETLKWKHNLSDKRIDEMGLSPVEKERLRNPQSSRTLVLNAATNESGPFYFEVLKRDKVGCGLGLPGLIAAFPALSASDSLEAGDAVLAHSCRRVWEFHKMGHETRYGPNQGGKANFITEARKTAFEKATKGKQGHVVATANFDHAVDFPRVDPKHFDEKRYDGIARRLLWWSLPLGQLLTGQGQQPQWMAMLETQAAEERREIARHLALTLKAAFKLKFDFTVEWGHECFREPRVFADLLKAALAAGPLSQETFLRTLSLDPEVERARKEKEAGLPKEQTYPLFDAAHGVNPSSANLNGRPRGQTDSVARNGEPIETATA